MYLDRSQNSFISAFYLRVVYVMKTTRELLIYFPFGCIRVFQVVFGSGILEGRCVHTQFGLSSDRENVKCEMDNISLNWTPPTDENALQTLTKPNCTLIMVK